MTGRRFLLAVTAVVIGLFATDTRAQDCSCPLVQSDPSRLRRYVWDFSGSDTTIPLSGLDVLVRKAFDVWNEEFRKRKIDAGIQRGGGGIHVRVTSDSVPLSPGHVNVLDWEIRGAADYNSDGMADLLWHNKADDWVVVWTMNGTTRMDYPYTNPSQVNALVWRLVGPR